jgi:hypothetical protein
MPVSAADIVRPAFQHTVQQLFKPFRLGQWIRLAFTGLLAGELTGGGSGLQFVFRSPNANRSLEFLQAVPPRNALLFAAIPLLIVLIAALIILLIYVSSRMRFVLFDSVVTRECHVRRFWTERRSQGLRYFVFQLLFSFAVLSGIAIVAGTGLSIAFGLGWLRNPRQHLLPLILAGILFFVVLATFVLTAIVITVLTKDFVVPQMAVENVTVVEGWSRLWSMLNTEKAGYAGYIGLKILLSIAAAVALGIAAFAVLIIVLLPVAAVAIVVVLGGRAIGLVWNVYAMSLAIVAGCIVLATVVFGVLLVSVPTIVFFPAYSMYFFAERYPPLRALLYAPPPQSNM